MGFARRSPSVSDRAAHGGVAGACPIRLSLLLSVIIYRSTIYRSEPAGVDSLAEGPKHGYAITLDVEQLSGGETRAWTLYGALSRLEAQGLIEAIPAEARRRPYRLTEAGREALGAQLQTLERVARQGARPPAPGGADAMRSRVARIALRLYPLGFRRRYESEMRVLIEERPPGMWMLLDLCRGALAAHSSPSRAPRGMVDAGDRMRGA